MTGGEAARGGGGDIEGRVSVLEAGFAQINGQLELIVSKIDDFRVEFTRLDERMKGTASSAEIAEINGRLTSLPTTWQMITLVIGIVGTILGGAFLILKFGLPRTP